MSKTSLMFAVLLTACAGFTAQANVVTYSFTQNSCSGGCGTAPFGSVTLTDNGSGTSAFVSVVVTLNPGEVYAGTGAGDALEFNVAGAITITSLSAGFAVNGADSASGIGSFLDSVSCDASGATGCSSGTSKNFAGPLSFNVGSATGVTTASFIADAAGYFFSADILGNNGNTGNVAANTSGGGSGGSTPEPASVLLSLTGLGLVVARLRKRA